MHVVGAIIFACWIAFWVYWLAASVGVKAGQTQWTRFAGVRLGLILVVLILVRAGLLRGHAVISDAWPRAIGLSLFFLGLALAVWARVCLGRNWGMPMSRKADPELVTTGPYRSVRHPIYSGVILAMIGTAIAVNLYWLIVAVLIAAYFGYSAIMEERFMADRFPDSYPAYQRATKMLIPYICLPPAGGARSSRSRENARHASLPLFRDRRWSPRLR